MDFSETSKFLIGIVTVSSTVTATYFNLGQARKIKAELLAKFETALEKEQKHSVTELFRLIHGLRMSYVDVAALVEQDECSKIIYALKKTPGLVRYRDGRIEYSAIGRNRGYRFVDKWLNTFGIWSFGVLVIFSLGILVFGKGALAVVGLFFTILSSLTLGYHLRQKAYNQMIANLVDPTK